LEHITLPALAVDGSVATREVLEVERLGATTVQLLHSPAYVHGVAAGDVIALDQDDITEFRVVERSGLLAVVLALPSPTEVLASVRSLTEWVETAGGRLDGGPPRLLVFSIPITVGFASIESQFDAVGDTIEGASWWYNNVYDVSGEHLLDWWSRSVTGGMPHEGSVPRRPNER
jgi:hypothetical protein